MYFLILLLTVPFLVGYILVFLKIEAIYGFTVDFYYWLKEKRLDILSGKGKLANVARYTLEPVFSLLIAINDWTDNIENSGTKSGVRIAGYLYLIGTILFIFYSLGQFIFLLAFICIAVFLGMVLLKFVQESQKRAKTKKTQEKIPNGQSEPESRTFVESIWPHFRSRTIKQRVEDLFDLKHIEVDYHGDIFSSDITAFPVKTKIGRVDMSGGIYDTRKEIPEKIGSIDVEGNIVDERLFGLNNQTH